MAVCRMQLYIMRPKAWGGPGPHQSEIKRGSGELRIFFLVSEWTMMLPRNPSKYCALKCEWYLGVKH